MRKGSRSCRADEAATRDEDWVKSGDLTSQIDHRHGINERLKRPTPAGAGADNDNGLVTIVFG
jgi:hypothetical protein